MGWIQHEPMVLMKILTDWTDHICKIGNLFIFGFCKENGKILLAFWQTV